MKDTKKTAIIIGAGPAGLTAAYTMLKETDCTPIILEESDFIGGISRTAEYKGNRMDIGGHRFFSKSDEVNRIWEELMPMQGKPAFDDALLGREKPLANGGPDPEKEERVMLCRDRVSRIYYLKKFFDYPISLKFETFKNMGLARTMKAGFGYLHSAIVKKPEDSLKNFYINRFGRPLYEMFFEDYTEKLWGRNPDKISADWGAQRVKGLSLWGAVVNVLTKPFRSKSKVETSLIEQYSYPKRGPGQLWETMAEEIKKSGGEIIFGARVKEIKTENGKITAVIAEINGEDKEFSGDAFFSSMPVKDLIAADAAAPAKVCEVARDLPYRDFITVGLLLDKMNLKNTTKMKTLGNIVPDCWIYVQEREVRLGRLQIFNNWSPYMVADPQNTVWIGLEYFCSEGDDLWEMSDEDFINFAADELTAIGVIDRDAVRDAVRIKVKKAYPAYFDSYKDFDVVKNYLDSIENLWCIGRNGQHRYNNMDHSMLTAVTAVRCFKNGIRDRSDVWSVNTEKEYHETKKAD